MAAVAPSTTTAAVRYPYLPNLTSTPSDRTHARSVHRYLQHYPRRRRALRIGPAHPDHPGAETADCEGTRLTRTAFGVSGSAADTSTVR
ncbi:hypothetical protein C5E46_02275 [Nocardia nova]|nr:hypothetical protein C5E46_02275 [Nocardia nova]